MYILFFSFLQHNGDCYLQYVSQLTEAVRWEYWKDRGRNGMQVFDNVESLGRVESSAKWNAAIALIAARLARRVARLYVYRYSQPAGVDLEGRQYNFTGSLENCSENLVLQEFLGYLCTHSKRYK